MKVLLLFFLIISFNTKLYAQDYAKGYRAYNNGDYKAALKEFEPLALMGIPELQVLVGEAYMTGEGEGVPIDYKKSLKFFQLAANQPNKGGQHFLGHMYKMGKGVDINIQEAIKYYRMSAEQGFANAHNDLGNLYHYGMGVMKSKILAHMWYQIAAVNGYSTAKIYLAEEAAEMTEEQIHKSLMLSIQCISSNYKYCEW
jgi:TPR repeat protein